MSKPNSVSPICAQGSVAKSAALGALVLAVGAGIYALFSPKDRKQVLTAAGLLVTAAGALQKL